MLPPMIHTVVTPPALVDSHRPQQTFVFDISVSRGDALLWRGRLRAATSGPAIFSQQLNESFACAAPDGPRGGGRSLTGLSVSLFPNYGGEDQASFRISARFQRPSSDTAPAQCDQATSRTVELEGTIHPEMGRPITLTADAGYAVSVTLMSRN